MLTTMTSAAAARSRAASAKQTSPIGHRLAPGHSSLPTDTACQARSCGAHERSAWSPVVVEPAQATRRLISTFVVAANSSISSWPVSLSWSSRTRCMHT